MPGLRFHIGGNKEWDFRASACNSKEFALLYILSDYDASRLFTAIFLKG